MDDIIIGIDLGTTNSMAASVTEKGPMVLFDDESNSFTPSVVCYTDKEILVGQKAIEAVNEFPLSTFFSFKRFMGRSLDDIKENLEGIINNVSPNSENKIIFKAGDKLVSPEEMSAEVLKTVSSKSQAILKIPIKKAVITVPAYFDDGQRQATRNAALIAGIEPVRIINEPTAAAIAYGLDKKNNGKIVVYDFGGGTFDVSVLDLKGKIFRVLSTNGDTLLGGDDIDQLIANHINNRFLETHNEPFSKEPGAKHFLKIISEKIKLVLSTSNLYRLNITDPVSKKSIEFRLTIKEFNKLITPIVEKSLSHVKAALSDAGISHKDVDDVVMVGGSTRIPYVRSSIAEYFDRPPHVRINPDQVVAIGASIQGHLLMGKRRDFVLMDVIPLSLGIETVGGTFSKLIMKNSPIPTKAEETYSTSVDNQTGIDINVYQGEREMVKDCRLLGRIKLTGIPAMPAGFPRLVVSFMVDNNGILNVTAEETRSETKAAIEIIPEHGLSPDMITQIINDSFDHAISDFSERNLADFRAKAKMMINGFDKVKNEAEQFLSLENFNQIILLRNSLEKGLEDATTEEFKKLLDEFGQSTLELSDLVISKAVSKELI